MKKSFLLISVFAVLFFSQQSFALVEARVHYGILASKPDLENLYTGGSSLPDYAPVHGIGGDLLVNLPFADWAVGFRYEDLGLEFSNSNLEFKSKLKRTSILANYRLINTLIFLGPIVSYGLSHDGNLTVKDGANEISNFTSKKGESYTVGLEAGVKLLGLHLGAEVGWQSMKLKDADDTGSANRPTQDIDYSGNYARVLLGLGF